jgi:hypothetical protein
MIHKEAPNKLAIVEKGITLSSTISGIYNQTIGPSVNPNTNINTHIPTIINIDSGIESIN